MPVELMRCISCGSLSSSPIPSAELIERYYTQYYPYLWFCDHLVGKRRDAAERVEELAASLGPRVLDFGGGIGYLAEALRKRGFDASVYDPYVDRAATKPIAGSFDAVVCLHVLEHAPDPLAFLCEAASFLKPAARLILAVPNASGAGYRQLGMRWAWALPPIAHIHHFTARGMRQLLDRAGFRELQLSFHERWDANSVSDIASFYRSRAIGSLWAFPGLNRVAPWRKAAAWLAIQRRFRELEEARRLDTPVEDRAELRVVATIGPS